MSGNVLEKLLLDLESNADEPVTLIESIQSYALAEGMDLVEQQHTASLLLHSKSPPNLLVFLTKHLPAGDLHTKKAKSEVCKFLAKFIKVYSYEKQTIRSLSERAI